MTRVCILHTVAALPAVFAPLIRELAPDADPYHVVDESLLADTITHGPLPRTTARLAAYVQHAEAAGAQAVLVTCSSVGPAAEAARPLAGIPVLRVDEPMAAEAVRTAPRTRGPDAGDPRTGPRIGVLATLTSTLDPTTDLIRRQAEAACIRAELTTSACPGAYEARLAGHTAEHDALIAAEADRLATADCDVLVLAQASMAAAIPADSVPIPVLTSPRSGTAQLAARP